MPGPGEFLDALSPDGTKVAVGEVDSIVWIFGPHARGGPLNDHTGYVLGWLDDQHIVIQHTDSPALYVIEVEIYLFQAMVDIASGGAYLGTFPAAVV